jgi:hypothetical protein
MTDEQIDVAASPAVPAQSGETVEAATLSGPTHWSLEGLHKVRNALDPDDWCGEEKMTDALFRAALTVQAEIDRLMACNRQGDALVVELQKKIQILSAAPQPAQTAVVLDDERAAFDEFMEAWERTHRVSRHNPSTREAFENGYAMARAAYETAQLKGD